MVFWMSLSVDMLRISMKTNTLKQTQPGEKVTVTVRSVTDPLINKSINLSVHSGLTYYYDDKHTKNFNL